MMEVICTEHDPVKKQFRSVREIPAVGGGTALNLFIFPEDTLEWRSAEYQIHPDETDLLLDIVMYESFLPPVPADAPTLFVAPTIDMARSFHINRVMTLKREIRPVANAWKNNHQRESRLTEAGVGESWKRKITDDALFRVRSESPIHVEVIAEKLRAIEEIREQEARKRRDIGRPSGAERAKQFRDARMARRNNG